MKNENLIGRAYVIPYNKLFPIVGVSDTSVDGTMTLKLANGTSFVTHVSNVVLELTEE